MDKGIESVIAKAVGDAERYPFLFIGSGLSLRYTGSPNWVGLLRAVCEDVLGDEFAYARYDAQARADVSAGRAPSELPHVATLMEPDVSASLLSSAGFEEFRRAHRDELLGGASPLKTYVADLVSGYDINQSEEIRALARAGRDKVSGVVTTNYDALCETLFPAYEAYVGEGSLLFSEPSFAQEIYEIHGSAQVPDSMVLTDADYAEFTVRRKYLAAKLLTIFVEYPVIFLGYSIQDENVKSILADVCECVPPEKLERLHDRLIFVQHGKETIVSDHTMDLNGRLLSMTSITTDDFMSVYEALLQSQRMYSPKVIRELRGSVFELAERIDPASEVVTSGFDAVLDHMRPDQRIAIQGGQDAREHREAHHQRGDLPGRGPRRPAPGPTVRRRLIPRHVRPTHAQRDARVQVHPGHGRRRGERGVLEYARGLTSLDSFRNASIRKTMDATHRRFAGHTTVPGLMEVAEPGKLFYFIPQLHDDEIDADELESALRSALLTTREGSEERRALLKESNFRKCVRIYDFLRYVPK